MVRVGFPGWKLLARLGLPVRVRVVVHFDNESKSFWAESPDLAGFAVAGESLEELKREADAVARALVDLELGNVKKSHGAVVTKPSLAEVDPCTA